MPRQLDGIELRQHLVEVIRLPAKGFSDLRYGPLWADLSDRDRAVAFGQPGPIRIEHQRDMRVGRLLIAQKPCEVRLPGRRRQKVVTAHHLVDALGRVVDDDGEVVGGHTVAAADDEVVDDPRVLTVQQIVDRVVIVSVRSRSAGGRPISARRSSRSLSVRSRHVPG